ncbi:MAG: hypothetical protein ACTHK8_19035 [Ginsengibacter sp.]
MGNFPSSEYEWNDLSVTAMGRTFERITEVEYDVEEAKKYIYGRGKKVKGIQGGNENPKGSLTLGQSEVEAMIREAQKTNPNAKLTDISFDIQVHYLKGVDIVKDRIVGAEFTNQAAKIFKQGDPAMEIKLPIMFMDLQPNIQ